MFLVNVKNSGYVRLFMSVKEVVIISKKIILCFVNFINILGLIVVFLFCCVYFFGESVFVFVEIWVKIL